MWPAVLQVSVSDVVDCCNSESSRRQASMPHLLHVKLVDVLQFIQRRHSFPTLQVLQTSDVLAKT